MLATLGTILKKSMSRLAKRTHRSILLAESSVFSLGGRLRFCNRCYTCHVYCRHLLSVALQEVISELGAPVSVFRKAEDPDDGYVLFCLLCVCGEC